MYRHKSFIVFQKASSFIIYNTKKPFDKGHTHVKRHDIAIILCKLASKRELPKSRSKYFLENLIRISDDAEYIEQIKRLM